MKIRGKKKIFSCPPLRFKRKGIQDYAANILFLKWKAVWRFGVLALASVFTLFPRPLFAGEERLVFLPTEAAFESLIADPREPHDSIILSTSPNSYEGAIGSTIELLQWQPADQSRWGWGIEGAGFIGLGSANYTDYPDRVVNDNGTLIWNAFPERVSDWYLGMYFSETSDDLSYRFEYLHVSSHLGDELFGYIQPFIYTRESFRFTASYKPSDFFRIYAGAGYWGHIDPVEKPFFLHGGMEIYSAYSFLAETVLRGYLGYDIKIKDEAGGVVNQAFQLGLQWKWRKETRPAIRLAILYYNGNNEYGQFYQQNDNHWGLGIYLDP